MFELLYPFLLLFLPLPYLIYRWMPGVQSAEPDALRVPFYGRVSALPDSNNMSNNASRLRQALLGAAWICLVVASAGPQWVGAPLSLSRAGRNIMMAVDISGSMKKVDLQWQGQPVDRLMVVKKVAQQFIAERQGDRLGLILFGSQAYLQTPLTFDRKTVNYMLQDASIGIAGTQTAMGDAIGLAIKRLDSLPSKHRVLILLTDGASNADVLAPIQAAKIAAQNHIRIYTIGLGADKMLVPGLLGPSLINPAHDLDEGTLKKIADITGGRYFRAKNTKGLRSIYHEIDALEPVIVDNHIFRPITHYYHYFLLLALVFVTGLVAIKLRPLMMAKFNRRAALV